MTTIVLLALAGWPVAVILNWLADVTTEVSSSVVRVHDAKRGTRNTHWRRPLVVLVSMATWGYLGWRFPPGIHLGLALFYTAVLIVITVTDLEHRLIPNRIIYPAIAIALLASLLDPALTVWQSLAGGIFAFGLFLLFAVIGRGALGGGDVKLAAFLGAMVGLPVAFVALFGGIVLGGLVSALLLLTRRVGLKSYIPYGPFLTTAGWVALVFGETVIHWWLGG